MSWRQLPNLITLIRFLLAVPVATALAHDSYGQALLLFGLAGCSDALDGFLARRFGWFTRLGSLLDPLADKVLLVTTFSVLTLKGHLPVSFLCIVLGRDVIILLGASAYHFLVGQFCGQPSWLSKVCTFLQIAFGILLVTSLAWQLNPVVAASIEIMQTVVLISCMLSGVHYVVVWGWRTRRQYRAMVVQNHRAFGK